MPGIVEVALTGGPCAGKTTAKNYIAQRMSEYGVRTFFIPEAASMVIDPGLPDIASLIESDFPRAFEFNKQLVLIQQSLRERYRALAAMFPDERCLIISDRGPCDSAAYIGWDAFEALLAETGLTLSEARDSFDTVIHMVTAANGAEEAYTLTNNAARFEATLEQARATDEATLQAWVGHPHLIVIDNSTDFATKLNRVVQALARVLGIPVPIEDERKYLLSGPPDPSLPELQAARPVAIEQHYLCELDGELPRIRRRGEGPHATYYRTVKHPAGRLGKNQELERRISPSEYLALMPLADPTRSPIRKTRWCFVWRSQYFELDHFYELGFWMLELELTEENQAVDLPPWLPIEREVTDEPEFYNAQIALKAAS